MMEIRRKEFQEALLRCLPGVDIGKTVLEGADTFIITKGRIYSYNDSVSVSVPSPVKLDGAVKAKELYSLISKFKVEEIEVEEIDGAWKFKAGPAKAELSLLESTIMEKVNTLSLDSLRWKVLPTNFLNGLSLCLFTGNNTNLSGVYIDGKDMFSTDENRINWYGLSKNMPTFWISDSAVAELIRLEDLIEYSLGEAWVHFRTKDGTTFSVKVLHHANYPVDRLRELVAEHEREQGDIGHQLPAELAAAVERAATLSMDIDSHPVVRLTIRRKCIEVYSQRSTGRYEERVPWDTDIEEDFSPVVLYVDNTMITYGLKRSKDFYIKEKEKDGGVSRRIIFTGENFRHMISTLQVNE